MTQVMIHEEAGSAGEKMYRAVSAGRTSTGRTAGEALDSLLQDSEVDLDPAYREMAADQERESEAAEWAEGTA